MRGLLWPWCLSWPRPPSGGAGCVLHRLRRCAAPLQQTGPRDAPIIVFVPGWTMPGWISTANNRLSTGDTRSCCSTRAVRALGNHARRVRPGPARCRYRRPAGPPAGQGGAGRLVARRAGRACLYPPVGRRAAGRAGADRQFGGGDPAPSSAARFPPLLSHDAFMRAFVAGMFHTPQPPAYLNRLTSAALRLPLPDAQALLRYPVPRSYWKEAVLSVDVPVLYVVRPHLQAQADNLMADRPDSQDRHISQSWPCAIRG